MQNRNCLILFKTGESAISEEALTATMRPCTGKFHKMMCGALTDIRLNLIRIRSNLDLNRLFIQLKIQCIIVLFNPPIVTYLFFFLFYLIFGLEIIPYESI